MFKDLNRDLPASIVVFFVALPLCLGIALASGAPLFSGIIAGIIGGIVVGMASGSPLGVSGPAAGLAVIVFNAIEELGGNWEFFLVAVVIGGIIQLIMGFAKAGFIAYFFPTSVIKGMLTGIGLLIILKQIPHALGWDNDVMGDFVFSQMNGENTFTEIINAFQNVTPGVLLITVISMGILVLWEMVLTKKHKIFQLLQGPIVVVLLGILMHYLYQNGILNFSLNNDQVVNIPVPDSIDGFFSQFTYPDFSALAMPEIWRIGVVIAIVASLETLLCVEATDKLDPHKRVTPTNRELKAQGLGNTLSGLVGGLPITQVIVRSSANIAFGGKTKKSAIIHGFFLLISAITIANVLNMIPLAS
ncbi:MAG: SulP family inorganic anion transporter, partial [Cyclobacteriaceae bacterium]